MSTLPTVLATLGGIALIAIALRDVFDVLFNETTRAVLAHGVTRGVWRAFRRLARGRPAAFSLAGPFALLAVVATWGVMLILGWTLVYWPHMPEDFNLGSGVDPSHTFVDALYYSMATLSTLGFGDITPATPLLRVISPLESILGFGLLTASISWLLSVYPVLSRRRSLAYEANLLTDSLERIDVPLLDLDPGAAEGVYSELTSRLVAVERDMATFPVAYYFPATDIRFSLPATMPKLLELAERGTDESVPERVRLRAMMLHEAIDDFAHTISAFHGNEGGSTEELLDAYRRDHLR
jgi:hypothetical protein